MPVKNFVKDLVERKATDFVKDLRGKYDSHVSETFIVAFLVSHFVKIHKQNPGAAECIIAHASALILFVDILEKECHVEFDGKTSAMNFASRFSERPIYM